MTVTNKFCKYCFSFTEKQAFVRLFKYNAKNLHAPIQGNFQLECLLILQSELTVHIFEEKETIEHKEVV